MFGNLLGPKSPSIFNRDGKIVLCAKNRLLGAIVFSTVAFLVLFVLEREEMYERFGPGIWWTALAVAILAVLIGATRLYDERPLMEIGEDGIAFPRMFSDVIPWDAIAGMEFTRGMMTVNFLQERKLNWYPKLRLLPGRPGNPGDGFLSRYEVPWIKVRVNYTWPTSLSGLRDLIAQSGFPHKKKT